VLLVLRGIAAAPRVQAQWARTEIEDQQGAANQRHVLHEMRYLVLRHEGIGRHPKVVHHNGYGCQKQDDQYGAPSGFVTQRDAESANQRHQS